jgi:hypothetical protein
MNLMKKIKLTCYCIAIAVAGVAQDTVHYTGTTLSNVDYHHGQLTPAVGVHNIQVMRANREKPKYAGGFDWTYNHASMIAYWNNTFYLQYLSNPVGEHIPPGQTLLMTSRDGKTWGDPIVVFPPFKIPDGTIKPNVEGVAKNLFAVMHQRMGFYVSSKNRLLTLGYYGIAMHAKDDPNDGNGIGRVVREVYADGKMGPIYFIRPNAWWKMDPGSYQMYQTSTDKGFVEACDELLSKPLMMQQWVEEADRNDPLIPLKKEYKAFSFYHLNDGRVVGLWKHALTSISADDGKTWKYNAIRAPQFVNSNAKIWGQKTSDGKFATVYNPSEFRWPLAISVSNDGLEYKNLLLVNGEISPMRYWGNYKSYGPQYVRGIVEGNGNPPDGNIWVTYSMNKEDIWVASVPVPVTSVEQRDVADNFKLMSQGKELDKWNIYSPVWARVAIEKDKDGEAVLQLKDADPFDYAKAERVIPVSSKMELDFEVTPLQSDRGGLEIECVDEKGNAAVRFTFGADSLITSKAGARYKTLGKYEAGKSYKFHVSFDCKNRSYTMEINDKKIGAQIFFAPVHAINRIVFRTGEVRRYPTPDTPADHFTDLPNNTGEPLKEAIYQVSYLKTKKLDK